MFNVEQLIVNTIETNVGYPIIIYYAISTIILTLYYRKELKGFFALIFSATIISFNSSLWELPVMLTVLMDISSFMVGLVYFIPLPLFLLVYNIRPTYNRLTISLITIAVCTSILFGLTYPSSLYYQLGQYYSTGYLSTFIPRTISLIALTQFFYPRTNQSRFDIKVKKVQST